MHSVGAKRFDLRSLSPALRNLWLLLASINFILLVFLFLLFLNSACQPGWLGGGTSCYKFFTSSKTWENAKEECQKWHAGLVKVESPEESEFIKTNVLPTSGKDIYWIGLSDSANEDDWMWTDETQLHSQGYTNWGSGQLDNVNNQDCVLVRIRELGEDY